MFQHRFSEYPVLRTCQACTKETPQLIKSQIQLTPTYMILTICLFDETTGQKLRYPLKVAQTLSFTTLDTEHRYRLAGMIVHDGNKKDDGHYFAYCRGIEGKWRKYDDCKITKLKENVEGVSGIEHACTLM